MGLCKLAAIDSRRRLSCWYCDWHVEAQGLSVAEVQVLITNHVEHDCLQHPMRRVEGERDAAHERITELEFQQAIDYDYEHHYKRLLHERYDLNQRIVELEARGIGG